MEALEKDELRRMPRIRSNIDIQALGLPEDVLQLLSHLQSAKSVDELCTRINVTKDILATMLDALEERGAIEWSDKSLNAADGGVDKGKAEKETEVSSKTQEPPVNKNLKCDLTAEEQQEIIAQEKLIESANYFEILGVPPSVRGADIRKAFLAGSKRFHPDMHFGKKLSDFRKRMEFIFRAMKEAHDFLSDDNQRKLYAKKFLDERGMSEAIVEEEELEELAEEVEIEMDPERRARLEVIHQQRQKEEEKKQRLEERRRMIRDERRSRVPAEGNIKKAHDLHEMGMEQLRTGDLFAAAASFKLASTFAPHNGEYRHRFKETQEKAVEQKATGIAETADLDASAGNPAQAAREYAEASDLVQGNERFAVRAAEEFFKKDDYDTAWFYANRAVKASPRSKKSRIVAATILEARQDYEGALVHAEMAQTIDKEDVQVKKMVKRLAKEVR